MTTADDIADTLYEQPPPGFTAARDAQIAAARTAGDKALATELGSFKRPSQAAWLVNLLARRRPEVIDGLVSLGQTIREAQGSVTPQQLRDLSARRRAELDGALALADSLATGAGEPAPTRAHLAEVEGTLAAAMADPDAADLVRAGRVLKALTYSGFGVPAGSGVASLAVGKSTAPAAGRRAAGPRGGPGGGTSTGTGGGTGPSGGAGSGGTHTAAAADAPSATRAQREQAEQVAADAEAAQARLAAATERVEQARRAQADAVGAEQDLRARTEALAAEIAERSERLERLHREARGARQTRLAAERDLASAQRRLDRLVEPS